MSFRNSLFLHPAGLQCSLPAGLLVWDLSSALSTFLTEPSCWTPLPASSVPRSVVLSMTPWLCGHHQHLPAWFSPHPKLFQHSCGCREQVSGSCLCLLHLRLTYLLTVRTSNVVSLKSTVFWDTSCLIKWCFIWLEKLCFIWYSGKIWRTAATSMFSFISSIINRLIKQ